VKSHHEIEQKVLRKDESSKRFDKPGVGWSPFIGFAGRRRAFSKVYDRPLQKVGIRPLCFNLELVYTGGHHQKYPYHHCEQADISPNSLGCSAKSLFNLYKLLSAAILGQQRSSRTIVSNS